MMRQAVAAVFKLQIPKSTEFASTKKEKKFIRIFGKRLTVFVLSGSLNLSVIFI